MSTTAKRAHVAIRRAPAWRLRLARESGRYLLLVTALFGLLASARFAIAPPRPVAAPPAAAAGNLPDLAAEGFAVRFARSYLAWRGDEPAANGASLEAFGGTQLEPDLGLQVPPSGEERVLWAEVVQSRSPAADVHVYTVAAQTSAAGLRYITVPVRRTTAGSLALAGYPAFVGAPASSTAAPAAGLRSVAEPALELVVRRALVNYLADSPAELAADLTGGARVSLPAVAMKLTSSGRQQWAPGGGAVTVLVQARDSLGVRYTLSYELDVAREHGRWEVSAIEADPDD